MDFKSNIISLFDYYDTPGARDLAHRVKRGDDEACIMMAEAIAEAGVIPPGTKIIPVPSSSGKPTNNHLICNWVAFLTDSEVTDCIRGAKREPLYDLKKSGYKPTPEFFGFRFKDEEPEGPCFVFDAVVGEGNTMSCVSEIFKKTTPTCIAYAMTDRNAVLALKTGKPGQSSGSPLKPSAEPPGKDEQRPRFR